MTRQEFQERVKVYKRLEARGMIGLAILFFAVGIGGEVVARAAGFWKAWDRYYIPGLLLFFVLCVVGVTANLRCRRIKLELRCARCGKAMDTFRPAAVLQTGAGACPRAGADMSGRSEILCCVFARLSPPPPLISPSIPRWTRVARRAIVV